MRKILWTLRNETNISRINILETELRNEQSRSRVDMSAVDSKIKGEYEAMLKRELKSLRKLYKASMKQSQEEFMRTYNQKVTREYFNLIL